MDVPSPFQKLSSRLNRPPDQLIHWTQLAELDLNAAGGDGERLLYAVCDDQQLLYLGKSKDLRLRLGYLAGGLASGDPRLHAGGARLRAMRVNPANLQIAIFKGDRLYRRHYGLVRALRPPANREGRLKVGSALPPGRKM